MFQENQEIFNFLFLFLLTLVAVIFLMISIYFLFRKKQIQLKSEIDYFKLKHQDEILKTQLEIQEYTFEKISKEIHDNISLGLTLAKLQTTTYIDQEQKDPKLLEFSIDLISKSLVDLNDISKSMDANQLLSHGLIKALESEITVLNKSGIFNIAFSIEGDPFYLDAESDLVLLRIFQESCNNIIKHAKASKIDLTLRYETDLLTMLISDNGIGFDLNKIMEIKEIRKRSGLQNISARAKLINANVNIRTAPGEGTTLEILTPIKNNQYGTTH